MIRILLVDDQAIVRQGIAALLDTCDDFEVVAQLASGKQCLAWLENPATEPDLLLMDIRMPELDGLATLAQLRSQGWQKPVVLMTTFEEPLALTQGIQLGANACLLKDAELDSFASVLRKVAAGGQIPLPAQHSANRLDTFTPRELEVIRELCAGKHNKEIASALGLSSGTVRNYVSSIMEKLGVQNRARALLKLRDAGLG